MNFLSNNEKNTVLHFAGVKPEEAAFEVPTMYNFIARSIERLDATPSTVEQPVYEEPTDVPEAA